MTKLFLAAGVAALAIAAPANAGPGGHGGGQADRAERPQRADREAARAERPARAERQTMRAERPQRAERQAMRAERPARVERQAMRAERPARVERQAMRAERPARAERQAMRAERPARAERQAMRAERPARVERQARIDNRQARMENRQARIDNRQARIDNRAVVRDQMRGDRQMTNRDLKMQRQELRAERVVDRQAFNSSRLAALTATPRTRFVAPADAVRFVGMPVTAAALSPLPQSISYLYPDTSDYYYRYNDGYMYRVNRSDNLIESLLPLLAGAYLPGQMLPNYYMNSYVPDYYGYNSFYPNSSYQCTRYANGVVYYVDCQTGLIEDVMPLYDSGYGVGQMLPSSYGYYNVPSQYRSLYYDSSDAGYWYAPGAIYQYDRSSSLITSVAALLSPGMTIGQQLPYGYSAYNVPLGYRDSYYDSPNAWYRYSNGYIYQVDPKTQLVSAIVASILT